MNARIMDMRDPTQGDYDANFACVLADNERPRGGPTADEIYRAGSELGMEKRCDM